MANMSYCRFENTAEDLQDVVDEWNSLDEYSNPSEIEAKNRIIFMAKEILENEGYEIEEPTA
jgi:hypothetical protein